MAAARPAFTSVESTASDLPVIGNEMSPPTYEQSDDLAHGGSGERTGSNHFPPEFGNLLPSREDPTSPPPPESAPPREAAAASSTADEIAPTPPSEHNQAQPQNATILHSSQAVTTPGTDVFVDAFSRPISSFTETTPVVQQSQPATTAEAPRNAFDDFDDFEDLSEAKEADNVDFGFGRQSVDEFNPAFDSPAPSQSQTPTPMTRSVQQSQESNGFANFTPNVSTSSTSPFGSGDDSVQQTPQNVQHDWDAIFSGLDSSKGVDTSFGSDDPWGPAPTTATTNGNSTVAENPAPVTSPQSASTAKAGSLGRAITPGTEHDDPILKRLTGMGYARTDALNALEMYDYDINKVRSSNTIVKGMSVDANLLSRRLITLPGTELLCIAS